MIDAVVGQQCVKGAIAKERAVVGQDTTAGNVDGAGDVTGNRIHGLDIAAETFRYARIEQRHTTRTGLLRR
ncbi:Uncharacterised protein [Mycobacterium tuberculosis]|nr:Uncharacterised protein [Mycobacterium tuberculosis]CKS20494.1 Uncharacterised protein [Mycobacterium tuberculosis]